MKLPPLIKSFLTDFEFVESINTNLVIKILNQPELIHDTEDWNETQTLKKLLKFSKNNTLKVKYGYSKKGVKYFGRVQSVPWNSLGVMRNEIRGTLCYDKYVDMDIQNAHLELASQLLQENGLNHNYMTDYCSNRELRLKDIMDIYGCSRGAAKDFHIKVIYGSSFEKWIETNEITKTTKQIGLWNNLKNEITPLANLFIADNHELYTKYTKVKEGQYNFKLGFLSKCLQHFELNILEHMFTFWLDNKFISSGTKKNCILCHDGIMIKKNKHLTPDVFDKLNNYIFEQTGFHLKVVSKEMNHYLDKIKEPEIKECTSKWFDINYMATLPFYNNKKDYFEKYHAKLIMEGSYINMIGGNVGYKKKTAIKETYEHLNSKTIPKDESDEPDPTIATKFIKQWIEDAELKTYDMKEYIPYNDVWKGMNEGRVFNTFSGYSEHIHGETDSIDDIKDIVLHLCEGNPVYYDFFVRWLAHIIQFPHEKLPYSVITNGSEGTGKGFLYLLMESILGSNTTSSDNIETFIGMGAVGLVDKLFINFNECSSSATRKEESKIKSLITETNTKVRVLYEGWRSIKNFSRVWVTGNLQNTIKIDAKSGERRFLAFRATDKYTKKGSEFWGRMHEDIKKPKVIAAWYQYLNNLDVTTYNFKEKRKECLSETYYNIIASNTPMVCSFISDYLDNIWAGDDSTKIHRVRKRHFYSKYKCWFEEMGGSDKQSLHSSKRFWHIISNELQLPIEIKRLTAGIFVEFDRDFLHTFMSDKGWISM